MSENHTPGSSNDRPQLPQGQRGGRGNWGRTVVWVIASLLLALWVWNFLGGAQGDQARISYSDFRRQLQAGNVQQVVVEGQRIEGQLESPVTRATARGDSTQYRSFVTHAPSFGDDDLMAMMEEHNVEVESRPQSDFPWGTLLLSMLPLLVLIGLGYLFFRRMRSQSQGIFSVRKSRAKLYDQEEERTSFDDVAGAESAKAELEEMVAYLKDPERFQRLGGEVPRGILLVGPPGTGKTLLARAVAGEAEVPFFSVSGSDFMEMFVGVGASRVRDMFEEAKKRSPSIIFIDELDSIGRQRGAGLGGGHDEREQTLNQLLSELDGFEPNESVIVLAATNRPDILDSALTRPGRFDRRITVDMPTMKDRLGILKIHASNKPLAEGIDLEKIARGTPGFSGADLENLLNEAALLAGRKDRRMIEPADVEEARDKVMMGLERKGLTLTDEERRLLAYHESGHAIVAAVLPQAEPIHKVSIIPRGKAMGVTQQLPERERYLYRREYMLDRLAVMMGGRAAEELVFDTATSGAENDLKQVTQLARKMILDWGMSDEFEHVALGGQQDQVFLGEQISQQREYSESTAREVDDAVRKILNVSYDRAVDVIQEHREAFDQLAAALLERDEVQGEDVLEWVGKSPEEMKGEPDMH